MQLRVVAGGDLTQAGLASHQVVGSRAQPSGDDEPADDAAFLGGQPTLVCQWQTGPAIEAADPGEEGASHRGDRVGCEHPGGDEVGAVGGNQLLNIGTPAA